MTMTRLMLKELKLANLIIPIIMLPLCALMFIPTYPYYIAFIYQCLAVFLLAMTFRESNDIYFSMLLPIRKRDMVRGRVLLFCCLELAQLIVAIPVAFLRHAVNPEPNPAGIEANPALFGSVLVMYGLFNLIFLPMHYKTAYKLGVPFGVAGGAVMLYIFVAERVRVRFVGGCVGPGLSGVVVYPKFGCSVVRLGRWSGAGPATR
jgi:hypothetical protein